jgi:hydrogenase maturation protease
VLDASPSAPLLIFACGNPSRGDDALGPECLNRLSDWVGRNGLAKEVDLLVDFQLQIEHALDLQGRERVLFIDAAVDLSRPCLLTPLSPERDSSFTSHAMSPAAVMEVYGRIAGPPPPAYLLRLRGSGFELGEGLSRQGREGLACGLALAQDLCRHRDEAYWRRRCGVRDSV